MSDSVEDLLRSLDRKIGALSLDLAKLKKVLSTTGQDVPTHNRKATKRRNLLNYQQFVSDIKVFFEKGSELIIKEEIREGVTITISKLDESFMMNIDWCGSIHMGTEDFSAQSLESLLNIFFWSYPNGPGWFHGTKDMNNSRIDEFYQNCFVDGQKLDIRFYWL